MLAARRIPMTCRISPLHPFTRHARALVAMPRS
jgi:hypothetical protein